MIKIIARVILFGLLSLLIASSDRRSDEVIMNDEFYGRFKEISPLKRNFFLESLMDSMISGTGSIESIDLSERYDLRSRIIVKENGLHNIRVLYYLFTNNEVYQKKFKMGDQLDFKGRFMAFTPLNTMMDSFVFDIVLSDEK